MKRVTIPGTGLTVSRFIFGTASLFNAGSARVRASLLHQAVEQGFTHFDTAPYYGFGLAERDLAAILRACPHVTFTTKVGIHAPGGEDQSAAGVFLRKALGKAIAAAARPQIDFSVARARLALEGSLRRTGRGTVDCYLLHEPERHLLDFDEWRRWQEDCVTAGKVRHFGAALTAGRLDPILASGADPGPVLQVGDSLAGCEADVLARHGRPFQITYGYLSAALRSPKAPPAAEVLRGALWRNPSGAIIVSTTRPERIAQFARILADDEGA